MQKTTPIFRYLLMLVAYTITTTLQAQITLTATSATTSGSYSTLKAAFDAINAGTHQGDISITITGNTTETATASLNASGSGSASYASLIIQPGGGASRTISGSINGGLITLNGADGVNIDGLNSNGNSLTIENSNTGTSASALIFTNGSTNNTITKCDIKGSNASTTTYTHGVVTFSSGINNNIQITYCNIGPSGSNRPSRSIVSGAGTNTSITIDNCHIFDFSGGAGTGINDRHSAVYLYYGTSSQWTITNNSIYQTSTRNLLTAGIVSAIYIRSGDGYTISNNYIGGSEPECGGSAMTYTGDIKEFYLIEMGNDIGYVNLTTINNNTIRNISFSSSSTSASTNNSVPRFSGIQVRRGKVTINYNLIGSASENGSISLTQTNSTFSLYYFLVPLAYSNFTVNVTNCNHNAIAGIDLDAQNFDAYGVYMEPYSGNSIDSFSYNTIGSLIVNNSITIALNTSSVTRNYFAGIFSSSIAAGARVISNNVVAGISRGSSSSTNAMYGISSFMDSANIYRNEIAYLSSGGTGSIYGIHTTYSADQTISSNFIHALGCTGNTNNLVYGIYNDYNGTNGAISNNIVLLGTDKNGSTYATCPFVGIGHRYSSNVYFNTVYINGSTASKNSYAYYEYFNSSSRIIKNNIFVNKRSNTSGTAKHYATYFYSSSGLSSDNNDYFVSGSGGTLGYLSGDLNNLTAIRSATGQDASSQALFPNFVDEGTQSTNSYRCKMYLQGVSVSGITVDYNQLVRGAVPMMGALDGYYWRGNINSDFANTGNWLGGSIPPDNAYVIFDVTPVNHCLMDANHIIGGLINEQNNFGFDLNGFELTLTGDLYLDGGAVLYANTTGSKLILAGNTLQEIPTDAIYNKTIYSLEINNPSGVILYDDDTVTNSLSMVSGDINMLNYTLVLGTSVTNTGTLNHTSGRVIGNMSRWYAASTNSGSSSGLFPLGYNGFDRFVTVEYSTAPTSGGTLTAYFNPSTMGTDGLPLLNIASAGSCVPFDITETSNEGYWEMTPGNGLTGGDYDITLVGQGFHSINYLCELSAIKRVGNSPWFESGTQEEPTGTLSRPVVKRTAANGWSNWGFGAGMINPLPVKFISMHAVCTNSNIHFDWTCAEEGQNMIYEIEVSEDGKTWMTYSSIQASGLKYSNYEIEVQGENIHFIRVVEISSEGLKAFSPISRVNCTTDNSTIQLYPNPGSDNFVVSSNNEIGLIEVIDMMGQVIYTSETSLNQINIDASEWLPGVYTVKVGQRTIRFIKQ